MKNIYYRVAHRSQEEINSFKTRYQDFPVKLIPDIFKKTLNFEVIDWKQSNSWGTSHVIYFVNIKNLQDPFVLRANLGFGRPEIIMKVEKLITDKVINLNIPSNKVIYVDISRKLFSFDFQIEEKLAGNDLEYHFKGTQATYDKMSFDIGKYVAIYQQLTFDRFGLFDEKKALFNILIGTKNTFFEYIITCLDEDLKKLVDFKVVNYQTAKKIRDLFDKHKPVINIKKGSLVHHDLADHNIMFENNKITGLFDWEAAVIGDPILDLASAPTWKTHYPREEKLIEGYKSIRKLPDYFQEKMNIYRLRTMIWKIVFAIRAGILNETRKQKFLSSLAPFKRLLPSYF